MKIAAVAASPRRPGVKATLRRYSLAQARAFAGRALACATAPQVRELPLPRVRR